MANRINKPSFLFEISWEVCNEGGGIYTVLSTKSISACKAMGDNYILIGPYFSKEQNFSEFVEDDSEINNQWKEIIFKEGVRVKIGHWNIEGSPKTILVDFSSLIVRKDEILKQLWEVYNIDSISGGWDYVEPVLFGIGSGIVIDSLLKYGQIKDDKVVAHFHEWMAASGGLYLRKIRPSIATVFTTHATVSGRCIAGNDMPLYSINDNWNIDELASKFGILAKHSIEKAAANNYDCFTTISEITSEECGYILKKTPDCITPNGFEKLIVPSGEQYAKKREEARALLIRTAEVSLGKKISSNPFILEISGRYEYKNKGIGEFIDGVAKIAQDNTIDRDILVYIMVPSWCLGPRTDLYEMLENNVEPNLDAPANNLTHILGDFDNNPIINRLRNKGLLGKGGKVSVMLVPAYLNTNDGIFNKSYYDLLIGMDLTVLPSYYEPWGYTPLESIAFGISTISTDLTGFGRWINSLHENHEGISIIHRTDDNQYEVAGEIKDAITKYLLTSDSRQAEIMKSSQAIADKALWENFYNHYLEAYSFALQASEHRVPEKIDGGQSNEQVTFLSEQVAAGSSPRWYGFMIEPKIPEMMRPLEVLSKNLWWSWNTEAIELFEYIDKDLWEVVECNPISLLDKTSTSRINELSKDKYFIDKMNSVYASFNAYMSRPVPEEKPKIAYFSMEYGIHASLKIYSGGLGILAGDYLKEASDKNVPMVAVGLLYRYGYFIQKVSSQGDQEANYEPQNFYKLPISPVRNENGEWLTVSIMLPGRDVVARIWRCDVGRTKLYLLDTDHEANHAEDRSITYHLYGGDWYTRMKQELLLGVGGIRALNKLGVVADVYHCNEGHAAFIGLERIHNYEQNNGLSFSEALEVVRGSSLFTTHTPVPAGHDAFVDDIIRQYMSHYPERLQITWEQFLNLGKIHPNDSNEKFSMSVLASNLSQEINGVSMLHGKVSRDILTHIWPGYMSCELDNIGYVTNGVHFPTWTSAELKDLYTKYFGSGFAQNGDYKLDYWNKVYDIPDREFWDIRLSLKNRLTSLIKKRLEDPAQFKFDSPSQLIHVREALRPDVLTIGFARRFATYKRAYLLFTNLERLDAIVNNKKCPVQFVFAGKAHPADKPGQDLIKRIIEVSRMPQFVGKIVFLQNYDIELARRMVQGVDIWLNTPTRPLEASGTSGEKAVMNGVMQFSVLDGWWVEGYKEGAGWALPLENTFQDSHYQDELDAEMIYSTIENEIVPLYYKDLDNGMSKSWVTYMKNCVAQVASNFTTNRMLQDYEDRYYGKLSERHKFIAANNFKEARLLAAWKRNVAKCWSGVQICNVEVADVSNNGLTVGDRINVSAKVELNGLRPEDIGLEFVVSKPFTEEQEIEIVKCLQLDFVSVEGTQALFKMEYVPGNSGAYNCALRAYAKNDKLVHRTDFALVKWAYK